MNLKNIVPALDWLPKYEKKQFNGDLMAGLTVGVMLIPQGMAYAMIAGLPPIYGLYASTVPLIIYALLGTSRQLAVGPVAMVSLLTAAGIGVLAEGGTEVYIGLAITLAFIVGIIQFLLGVFKLGFLVNFLSHPVISGFTSAAALIIGLSQLKHLLGVDIARSHHVHEILIQAFEKAGDINWITLAIGVVGILLIMAVKKWRPSIPGPLLAVVFGILVVWGFGLTTNGVQIVGSVPQGLPGVQIPSFNADMLSELLPIALAISLVSFMESIAVAKAIQAKHKNYKVIPNQELIALGAANIGGAFFQSYPVTGGFSRTAVNDQAGAKTGMAAIFSAALIILTLLFLTPLFYYLPKAILASVIMVAVFGLIDLKEAKFLWRSNRTDFIMLIVTFIGTLALGIEQGIGIGVVLSLAVIIFRTTRPHMAELGQVPGTGLYRNVKRFDDLQVHPETLVVRPDAQLYFANINYFRDRLTEMIGSREGLKLIVINAESISNVDSTAIHALDDIVKELNSKNINVYFSGVIGPVRDAMARGGLMASIGEDRFFMSVQKAIDNYFKEDEKSDYKEYTLQTNTD
ncbi:MAG: solute carrier family 26 protein [Saprospiraceae bacterium]|nr:solute carrier family 26 protein [Saprospiraceae bacterium]